MNIYVGNLAHATTDRELREAFEAFGTVDSAVIIKDKFTGDPRGFGFVEMPDDEQAEKAMSNLNDHELGGRTLKVNQARPRANRSRGYGDRASFGERRSY